MHDGGWGEEEIFKASFFKALLTSGPGVPSPTRDPFLLVQIRKTWQEISHVIL